MNLLVLLVPAAAAFAVLWAGQSLVLWWIHEPIVLPLRYQTRHPAMRRAKGILVPLMWAMIILMTPMCLGSTVWGYYGAMLAWPSWTTVVLSWAYVVVGFGLMHAIGRAAGYIRPHRDLTPARLRAGLLQRILVIPVPAALIEELVFRGVLLEQLLVAFPSSGAGSIGALAVSSAAFSSVHFVAPKPQGEPVWQAAAGTFFVGCAIGAGYIHGGRTLWLPMAIHAAGIAWVEAARLLTRFEPRGRWLVGTREFPHSGLYGIAGTSLLAALLLAG